MKNLSHASALYVDASRDLSFLSDLLEESPHIAKQHIWAVRIIANEAASRAARAMEILQEVQP